MSLLLLCALLFQQSHLFPICVVSTYNSRKDLHKICQILGNCQCKRLLVSSSAPRTFVSTFAFPEKFLFYMGMIGSIGWPSLVPPQRIDDYVETHILHQGLCNSELSNHQNCPLWARCTGASSARSPRYFRPETDIAMLVFRDLSKKCYVYSVPLLLAAPKVLHEKNWKTLDVPEHFHQ